MTISSTTRKAGPYVGNSSATTFAFAFKVFARSEVVVTLLNIASTVETVLTLDTDYTVTLNADQNANPGGVVTYNPSGVPIASTHKLTLTSGVLQTQGTDITNAGGFYPEVIENALDRATILVQQLSEMVGRAFKVPVSSSADATLPAPASGGGGFGWNAAGTAIINYAFQAGTSLVNLAASGGSALIGFIQTSTGAILRTVQGKLQERLSVKDFGAIGDGVTDDTRAIERAADALVSGQTLDFPPGTYLISHDTVRAATPYLRKVMYLVNKKDLRIIGENATIKCVNHDIAAQGGLMWLEATGCPRLTIKGFRFDMTFTGVKNSKDFYPFVGAILVADAPGTGVGATYDTLTDDITITDCRFKLYHPFGQGCTTTTGHDYPNGDTTGDGNNGFKMFSIFISGNSNGITYEESTRGIIIRDIMFESGHNGYGIWVWSYQDVLIDSVHAADWVGSFRNNDGTLNSGGLVLPMIRYHQFISKGLTITNCNFKARSCANRAGAFQGGAEFAFITTNATGANTAGTVLIKGNVIRLGNGDLANNNGDGGILLSCYGDVSIVDNMFDGTPDVPNAFGGIYIAYDGSTQGYLTIKISNNVMGRYGNLNEGIQILNKNSTAENYRRVRSLTVTDNVSYSQAGYFLDTFGWGADTYRGVPYQDIRGNVIVGTWNTLHDKNDIASKAFYLAASEATDFIRVQDNLIVDKYFFIDDSYLAPGSGKLVSNNRCIGVAALYNVGTNFTDFQDTSGTFTPKVQGTNSGDSTHTATGQYTRVNDRCFFDVQATVTAAGAATGGWQITLNDIPYTSKNFTPDVSRPCAVTSGDANVGAGNVLQALMLDNSKIIYLYANPQTGGGAALWQVATDSAFSINISGSYPIA